MKQTYRFFDGGTIEFDDRKSVKALIAAAFDAFDYYEPMGMEIVTLFQAHHPDTTSGWFTTDVARCCAEEIKNPNELCFAYHMPYVFYFAEGGWGHHMTDLGNRPPMDNAVALELLFDDFRNTVVINGAYTFSDIIAALKKAEYIDQCCRAVEVIPGPCPDKAWRLSLTDPIMKAPLTELDAALARRMKERHPCDEEAAVSFALRIC